MQAAILSIGDELALGQIVDTNAAYLSARLVELGILTAYHKVVPDDLTSIDAAFREAAGQAQVVLATGGLGPTRDDLTRQALARALGCELELDLPSLERIQRFFAALGRPMPETNRIQAMRPAAAQMLENLAGTAPGLSARLGAAMIYAMPGVPAEMRAMFEQHVLPVLRESAGRVIRCRTLHTFGLGESDVGERLGELMDRARNPRVGTTVSAGIVSVRIRSEFETVGRAMSELERIEREARRRLGDAVFGVDGRSLQESVADLLGRAGRTVATAESCTGGWAAKMLTDLPGSSRHFVGGWVVYANAMKESQLGVPAELLERAGAVSEEVVRTMALNALARSGADYALGISGIAGPEGGTPEKPAGTVWIALARRAGQGGEVRAERFALPGDRDMVRDRAAKTALNLLRLDLLT